MFDTYTGRFIQEDPSGFAAGDINLYRYVHNQPTGGTDPSGLSEIVLERLPDGRDAVYYVPEFIGWNVNGFRVWVGTHDPLTGRVYRENRSVPLARVQQLGHRWLSSTPNWPQVFRDEGETAESLRNARGDAGLCRLQSMWDFPRASDPNMNGREAGRMAIDASWSMIREAAVGAAMPFVARTLLPAERALFQAARGGGRHAGLLRRFQGERISRIQSAIRGHEAQVRGHLDKIANPSRHVSNWATLTPEWQRWHIRGWLQDAVRNAEEASVLRGLLETLR